MSFILGLLFGVIQIWVCFIVKIKLLTGLPNVYDFPAFMTSVFSIVIAVYVGAVLGSKVR